MAALDHRALNKVSPKGRAYLPVKDQVRRLYKKAPSLFCSHFYRLHRHRFFRPVAYSTVRQWLRDGLLLRRHSNGIAVTRRFVLDGKVVEAQAMGHDWPAVQRTRKWRRNLCWEQRERWHHIWLGWEKPGYGLSTPGPEEKRRFYRHAKQLAPLTPMMRAHWKQRRSPWDW